MPLKYWVTTPLNLDALQDNPRTIHELLQRNAQRWPDLTVLKFDSGETYSSRTLLKAVKVIAANLHDLGVRQNEYVLCWLPNGSFTVLLYLALNYLGAIAVPFNTAYRGNLLAHVLKNSAATRLVADGRLIERLQDIDTAQLKTLIIEGDERLDNTGLEQSSAALLRQPSCALLPALEISAHDTAAVIYTSGTTGPSKGVLCSYQHLYTSTIEFRHVGPGDTNLVALPMYHVGGILGLWFALVHGGCAAFVERFSTSKFWPMVKALEVTSVGLLGAMVQYLMAQPASPQDKNHPVKRAVIAPFGDDALAFGERFGIEVHTEFNMTELSVPLWGGPNPTARGTCGTPRQGVELKLVDARGNEVAPGEIGELLVHSDDPWSISHGYLNNPQASAEALRDGWFYTGDLFTRDQNDNYFFVDRAKDAIRRRGENISSFEVEEELLSHVAIKEAAVVGVAGDGGEEEILAILVSKDNCPVDIPALTEFLSKRLAHFMVPRYFRFTEELPRTPTQKVEKHVLRSIGLTADTQDREALGILLTADKLGKR